jgi:parafibromin
MATTERQRDPLLLLRRSIAEELPIQPTTSADASAAPPVTPPSLAAATHLRFDLGGEAVALPLDAATRFVLASTDKAVNLRSIYFAWLNRNTAIPEYNAAAAKLNEELGGGSASATTIQNLTFVERVNLFTWLEGGSEESEYIRPLAGDKDAGAAGAGVGSAAGAAGATVTLKGQAVPAAVAAARSGKGTLDPRLAVIYSGERKMGDRNSVLRGIKPTVGLPVRLGASGRRAVTAWEADHTPLRTRTFHTFASWPCP